MPCIDSTQVEGTARAGGAGPIYEIIGVTKTYRRREIIANQNIRMEIYPEEIFGLLGENGAGKTTLVRQMIGLAAPDSGRILLQGVEVNSKPQVVAQYVGYLPQGPCALQDLTPVQALKFTAYLRGMSLRDANEEAMRLVEVWQLRGFAHRPTRALSGGQQRLTGLALSASGGRRVMILDEPTNDLDPTTRQLVWQNLLRLRRESGATIVLITHNLKEAEQVVDRVAIMRKGEVLAVGAVADLSVELRHLVAVEIVLPDNDSDAEPLTRLGFDRVDSADSHWRRTVSRSEVHDLVVKLTASGFAGKTFDLSIRGPDLQDLYSQITRFAERS